MLITNEHRHIIKNHMAINNMTQAEFADTTGVNQKTVSDWLSGPFKKVRNSTAYVLLEHIPELKTLEKRLEEEKEIEAMNSEVDAIKANMDAEMGLDAYKTIRVIVDGLIADIMAANIDANKKVDLYMKIIARMDAAGVLVGK